jgi:hypothetical protein
LDFTVWIKLNFGRELDDISKNLIKTKAELKGYIGYPLEIPYDNMNSVMTFEENNKTVSY